MAYTHSNHLVTLLINHSSGKLMLSQINQLTIKYEQKHGFRPNLLYVNTTQLELLKEQLSEPDIAILTQLIGMDIVIVETSSKPHLSWAQIPWKHSKTA